MTGLSDLALCHRLEAEVDGQNIVHKGYQLDPTTGERSVIYKETWRRGRLLGHGASGAVLLEENTGDKNMVRAVKILSKTRDVRGGEDPFDEAAVMSILSRPQNESLFVNFFGWYETSDSICLLMEYIKLGDLNHYLYSHGPLEELDARVIVRQLLGGLEVVHRAGFIHRDLKPHNILIQHTTPWRVKICDFGISRHLKDKVAMTYTGKGTSGYKAPEISFDERIRHTTAVDMWSLGCVTHKILSNEIPFQDDREVARFVRDATSFHQHLDALSSITDDAKSFMKILIIADPHMRATASTAIKSIWMTELGPTANEPASNHPESNKEQPTRVAVPDTRRTVLPHRPQANLSASSEQNTSRMQFTATYRQNEFEHRSIDSSQSRFSNPSEYSNSIIATPNQYPITDTDAIRFAVDTDNGEVLLSILANDVVAKERVKISSILLHDAVELGRESIVSTLLDFGALVDEQLYMGQTPLTAAAAKAHEVVIKTLLERGADINARDDKGRTALMWATRKRHLDIIRILLDGGANTNPKDAQNGKASMVTASEGHASAIQVLPSAGADVDAQDEEGWTALIWAASKGHVDVVQILLEGGANADIQDDEERTALIWAASRGHKDVVRALLKEGANVDTQDDKKYTALMWAVSKGHLETVQILLNGGANASLRNHQNGTALSIASARGRIAIAKMLET